MDTDSWMRGRKMSQQPAVTSVLRTQGGPNEDQAVQWVVTTFNRGQWLSPVKPEETWCLVPELRGQEAKKNTELSQYTVSSTGKD